MQPNGTSALMMACSVGNVEAARALLMFGAALDLEDVRVLSFSLLDIQLGLAILTDVCLIHTHNQVHGMTALMIAARDGKVPCLKLLIRKGARINLSRNRVRDPTFQFAREAKCCGIEQRYPLLLLCCLCRTGGQLLFTLRREEAWMSVSLFYWMQVQLSTFKV